MRQFCNLRILTILLSILVIPVMSQAASRSDRLVLAFYYTWYGTPDYSDQWMHWNEGGHQPGDTDREGLPDIGATHHPDELYDSFAPGTIERHLRQAEKAGVDVLVASWWGKDDRSNKVLDRCLFIADKEKSPLQFAAYYETVDPPTVQRAVADLELIVTVHGDKPNYLKVEGRPVIFIYGRAMNQLSLDQWREVSREVHENTNAFLVADSDQASFAEVFDGLHNYNIAREVAGGLDLARVYGKLVRSAHLHGKIACANVLPGYDDSNIGRDEPFSLKRENGKTYRRLWEAAIASQPDWIVITSWNEWHEGTEIEPSVEQGVTAMNLTAEMAKEFKEAKYTTMPAPEVIDSATCVLGAVNAATGLWQVEWEDGRTKPDQIGDTSCRRLVGTKGQDTRYIYFDVDEGFDLERGARVFVYYYDAKPGSYHIEYDADAPDKPLGGAYKHGIPCTLTGDGHWKEYMFMLPDALFQGRENGMADFRFALTDGEAAFHRVYVQTPPAPKAPAATPTPIPMPKGYGE